MSFDVARWATEEYFTDGGGLRPVRIRETRRLCGKSQGCGGVGGRVAAACCPVSPFSAMNGPRGLACDGARRRHGRGRVSTSHRFEEDPLDGAAFDAPAPFRPLRRWLLRPAEVRLASSSCSMRPVRDHWWYCFSVAACSSVRRCHRGRSSFFRSRIRVPRVQPANMTSATTMPPHMLLRPARAPVSIETVPPSRPAARMVTTTMAAMDAQ